MLGAMRCWASLAVDALTAGVVVVVGGCFPSPPVEVDGDNELDGSADMGHDADDAPEAENPDTQGDAPSDSWADSDHDDSENTGDGVSEDSSDAIDCESIDDCPVEPCWIATCFGGTCGVEPKRCDAPPTCQGDGHCDLGSGECLYSSLTSGETCDDHQRCTAGEQCRSGACVSTRPSADEVSDFARGVTSNAAIGIAGLAVGERDVLLAVNITNGPADSTAYVDFGLDAGGAAGIVSLPDGAFAGVALARYSLLGELRQAELVLWSAVAVESRSIAVLANGDIVVAGHFETGATLRYGTANPRGLSTHEQTTADFVARLRSGNVIAATFEREPPSNGPIAIDASAEDCLLAAEIAAGRSLKVFSGDEVVDSFVAGDDASVETWLVSLPSCGTLTTSARRLSGPVGGGTGLSKLEVGEHGHALVIGVNQGGLRYGDEGTTELLLTSDVIAGYFVALGDRLEVTAAGLLRDRRFEDLGGFAMFHGGAIAPGAFHLGMVLNGYATMETLAGPILLAGNPPSQEQVAPRVAIARLGVAGSVEWMFTANEDKARIFEALTATAGGVVAATSFSSTTFDIGEAAVEVGVGGGLAASWGESGRRWATGFCAVDVGDPPMSAPVVESPLQVVGVPGTEGVIITGMLADRCALGVARPILLGEPGKRTAFVARINSEDGVGCPDE